ncbi:hypothetical protein APHAL10511_004705 [Amanita phalloides]|nr:hypothetical protein APHAL10511_004705 [Amanita phalloides]
MATVISTYTKASDIPTWMLDTLNHHGHRANVILPNIEKFKKSPPKSGQLWIAYASEQKLEHMIAVTDGPMGPYPAFIFTTKPLATLHDPSLTAQMSELAQTLKANINVRRIYSVFAAEPICTVFCRIWTELTGICTEKRPYPYYDSLSSFCTRETLRLDDPRPVSGYEFFPRLARNSDIEMVALMCQGFAHDSEPFVLDHNRARDEAKYLVKNGLVWVCMGRDNDMDGYEVASIVACTRNTEKVATITKVYTPNEWRGKGCAGRLVHHVCKELLDSGKDAIALYVGINNPARRLYARTGFVGLGDHDNPVEGVERWVEYGFDRKRVDLGHW